ncbi:golgin subfamily A member 6-like protein 2 [Polypterus senegalus]|uniref:golgin subfamily A member 6-like protein 2 n=1 Tax=Polypterus senegalus TaxID=55291 RepID=UPI0019666961|nr:golgin subfamily A member 6-like protein 2 [Polypterus senegalus]XP_039595359.1 golgin subfamily A member 6-like protein 2 [Polypterus senegalus]XP_039595360.1 golgin subfamily A member 6-like protein 2 [Polypterus senegalus]
MEAWKELVDRGMQLQKKKNQLQKQEERLRQGDLNLRDQGQRQREDEQRTRDLEQHLTNLNLRRQEPFSQGLKVMKKISEEIRQCLENFWLELDKSQQQWELECRQWEEERQRWEEDWHLKEMEYSSNQRWKPDVDFQISK